MQDSVVPPLPRRSAEMLKGNVVPLDHDGNHGGQLLLLNLPPWFSEPPLHIRYLNEALGLMTCGQGGLGRQPDESLNWYCPYPPAL